MHMQSFSDALKMTNKKEIHEKTCTFIVSVTACELDSVVLSVSSYNVKVLYFKYCGVFDDDDNTKHFL